MFNATAIGEVVNQGEHLAAYAGESVVMRYNPRDITTVFIYQPQDGKEVFLTRAHAQGLETECLSYAEAQAISRQIRASGRAISNQSILSEVRDPCGIGEAARDSAIEQLQRQKRQQATVPEPPSAAPQPPAIAVPEPPPTSLNLKVLNPLLLSPMKRRLRGKLNP